MILAFTKIILFSGLKTLFILVISSSVALFLNHGLFIPITKWLNAVTEKATELKR